MDYAGCYSLKRMGEKAQRVLCLDSFNDAKRHANNMNPNLKWEGSIGEEFDVDKNVIDSFSIEKPVYALFGFWIWVCALN